MKKSQKRKVHDNPPVRKSRMVSDDTMEFLSLDDEMIAAYGKKKSSARAGKETYYESDAGDDRYYMEEEDDDRYYEEEDDLYYAEEEEDDRYYEEEDRYYADDEDDDRYYAEEDDERYYGEEEDRYYEDDEYYEIDDEYYEMEDDDAYYEEDDEERDGFFDRIGDFFSEMSAVDGIVAALGIFILAAAVVTGTIFFNARSVSEQVDAFAEVGTEIENISVIGESGLIAVADAESARISQMIGLETETETSPEAQDGTKPQNGQIVVGMNLTSIQSDIKIKIVNKETNKLIGGVPFEVEITGGNKTLQLKDEDKDGIIHQTGLGAGTYTVTITALSGAEYEKYLLPSQGETVNVTDKISYKKVEVADEIKTEAEVNAAVEDTAQQNTVVESTLKDTVEWVESSKTEDNADNNYEVIKREDIPDPSTIARAGNFVKLVNDTSQDVRTNLPEQPAVPVTSTDSTGTPSTSTGTTETPTTSTPTTTTPPGGSPEQPAVPIEPAAPTDAEKLSALNPSLNTKTLALAKGGSATLSVAVTGNTPYTVEWSSSSPIASVNNGVVTGVGTGNAVITATVRVGSSAAVLNCSVSVTETTVSYTAIKIEGSNTVQKGSTSTLKGTTTPEGGVITWTSNNTGIVEIDSNGIMTGVSEGTAVITGTCGGAKADWQVTVTKNFMGDTVTKLKDKKGNQIYVKNEEGKYVEAVYADYYNDKRLYLRKANAECFYTGWQTIDGHTYFYDKNGNYVTGEQIIQGAKYSFDSQGRMSNNSGVLGIDVSKWNGSIDWNAVKNSGVSYVIIRCGYRGSSTGALIEDPKFASNIKGAKAAGLKVGVYFFSQAVNEAEAVEEASMALNLVSGYGLEYPVFLDVEASNGRGDAIDAATRTAVCRAFCATIQNSGYKAGIYANKTWLTSKINAGSLTDYKIWLAQYASAPSYTTTRYDMWQYTSKGNISGISGSVDMNISYLNY